MKVSRPETITLYLKIRRVMASQLKTKVTMISQIPMPTLLWMIRYSTRILKMH